MYKEKSWYELDVSVQDAFNNSGIEKIKQIKDEMANCHAFINTWAFKDLNLLFSNKFIKNVSLLSFPVESCIIFYRKKNYIHPTAHIDAIDENNIVSFGLNWVLDYDYSEMVWYDVKNDNSKIKLTSSNTGFIEFNNKSIKEKEKHIIGNKLTLVRTDIPHNIIVNSYDRLSISLRVNKKYRTLPWVDIVNFYKESIIQ